MNKSTAVTSIIISGQSVRVVASKMVIDGDQIVFSEPHCFVIDDGADVIQTIASVNNHLLNHLNYPEITQSDIDKIKSIVDATRSVA